MKLTQEQIQAINKMQEVKIAPKHTGWRSVIRFNRWEKYGHVRLYYSFAHYDRNGQMRNSSKGKGYIDLNSGEVKAPPSDKILIKKALA
jgi:hypothetical protein